MTNPANIPAADPPSSGRLLRSTLIAAGVAILILVTIVLPAEYGVDPTRVGRILGLTEMGEIKMQLAREEAAAAAAEARGDSVPSAAPALSGAAAASAVASGPGSRADTVVVTIAPTQAREVKLVMVKDAEVRYAWAASRGVVNYDMHADNPSTRYHGYTKGTGVPSDSGTLRAAFDGQHGFFWRNRGRDTVTMTLRVTGAYTDIKHVQ